MNITAYLFIISSLIISPLSAKEKIYVDQLRAIMERFAPDERFSVFTATVTADGDRIIAGGDVDKREAKIAVLRMLAANDKRTITDNIEVLPEVSLGDDTCGITTLSVANIRKHPDNKSELINQALLGTVITLLKDGGYFWLIKMPDGYIGWMNKLSFERTDSAGAGAWSKAAKVVFTGYSALVHRQPDQHSESVCDVVTSCIMKRLQQSGGWTNVGLADGRSGYIPDDQVEDLAQWQKERVRTADSIEKTAKTFLGTPYLWGGTSIKGFDCSGFTKTVFLLNGVTLLRDADLQATMGKHIEPGENFENLKKGDLLFFGRSATMKRTEQIKHVAIYLGDGLYIHSSGRVRVSSLFHSSQLFDESLRKEFVRARRILHDKG